MNLCVGTAGGSADSTPSTSVQIDDFRRVEQGGRRWKAGEEIAYCRSLRPRVVECPAVRFADETGSTIQTAEWNTGGTRRERFDARSPPIENRLGPSEPQFDDHGLRGASIHRGTVRP